MTNPVDAVDPGEGTSSNNQSTSSGHVQRQGIASDAADPTDSTPRRAPIIVPIIAPPQAAHIRRPPVIVPVTALPAPASSSPITNTAATAPPKYWELTAMLSVMRRENVDTLLRTIAQLCDDVTDEMVANPPAFLRVACWDGDKIAEIHWAYALFAAGQLRRGEFDGFGHLHEEAAMLLNQRYAHLTDPEACEVLAKVVAESLESMMRCIGNAVADAQHEGNGGVWEAYYFGPEESFRTKRDALLTMCGIFGAVLQAGDVVDNRIGWRVRRLAGSAWGDGFCSILNGMTREERRRLTTDLAFVCETDELRVLASGQRGRAREGAHSVVVRLLVLLERL